MWKWVDDAAVKKLVPLHSTLTHLNLRGCPITDKGLESVVNLTRLRTLDISRSTVVRPTCYLFGECKPSTGLAHQGWLAAVTGAEYWHHGRGHQDTGGTQRA